ncbi:hypothetical protein FQN57_001884 [Myotisia sp. PD_48]|nr:hypothetical protein FQN57_001884 [Myotisia sp. PD_48]
MSNHLADPSSSSPFKASSDVRSIHSTLHLLYHHNKNQHRCTKWWKWLGMLKRWTLKLACEIERIEKFEDVRNFIGDGDERHPFVGVWEIMSYLRHELVPRCYTAFSTVIADLQFTSLGVVLLASLSEVFNIVKDAQIEHEAGTRKVSFQTNIAKSTLVEDLGETVHRSDPKLYLAAEPGLVTNGGIKTTQNKWRDKKEDEESRMVPKVHDQRKVKKKSKKRKVNAIDDIFGGF